MDNNIHRFEYSYNNKLNKFDYESNTFNEFIIKSLDYYDSLSETYIKLINDNTRTILEDGHYNNENNKLYFINSNIMHNYEILGYYDKHNKIWIWSWALNNINNNKTKIVNELLISTLSLEMSGLHENIFIKSCFTNSRIAFDNDIEFDVFLALVVFNIRNKCIFLYNTPKDTYNQGHMYYIIKK
jgi:hypothetical protein